MKYLATFGKVTFPFSVVIMVVILSRKFSIVMKLFNGCDDGNNDPKNCSKNIT
jgi:hypothetical protein